MNSTASQPARPLRFRAWDKMNRSMYSWLGDCCAFALDIDECRGWHMTFEHVVKSPDQFVVMQSTGLKDKNGVEIYEGDIVRYTWANPSTYIGVVRFGDGRFYVGRTGDPDFLDDEPEDGVEDTARIEVIGNIYEHPHLLS